MAELGPEALDLIVETAGAQAAEIAAALERAFDTPCEVTVGERAALDLDQAASSLDEPGLVVCLRVGQESLVGLLPESASILPEWYAQPDVTGTAKLQTLALELGVMLLPSELMPEESVAGSTASLSEALSRSAPAESAMVLPLEIRSGEEAAGTILLVVPATIFDGVVEQTAESSAAPEAEAPKAHAPEVAPPEVASPAASVAEAPAHPDAVLPCYTQNLLRVELPLRVTLASKRQSLTKVTQLCPGDLIQFEKSCEELLELSVGDQPVGAGEAVKVGDRFGIRLVSMLLPAERFKVLAG